MSLLPQTHFLYHKRKLALPQSLQSFSMLRDTTLIVRGPRKTATVLSQVQHTKNRLFTSQYTYRCKLLGLSISKEQISFSNLYKLNTFLIKNLIPQVMFNYI